MKMKNEKKKEKRSSSCKMRDKTQRCRQEAAKRKTSVRIVCEFAGCFRISIDSLNGVTKKKKKQCSSQFVLKAPLLRGS